MTGPWVSRAISVLLVGLALTAVAPAQVTIAPCTVTRKETACNWHAFEKLLTSVQVMSAEFGNLDRPTGGQLKEFIASLGKRVADADNPGQLTILAVPVQEHGINVGSADEELVEIRIYAGPTSNGPLVWVESYRGQADKPYGANVHFALEQLRERMGSRK